MPLAIELTAARTSAFTVGQLAERLDDRFRLLTGGARTALPRHQTLRAVTDWSYDLLFDDERTVFERLAVFAGGCTLEAAEAVCSDDDLAAAEIGGLVGRLVDKSLVVADGSGRFRLLLTLAQYGRERLDDRDDGDAVRDRHAAYYADLAEQSSLDWHRPGGRTQVWWLACLTTELDNVRAALEWSIGGGRRHRPAHRRAAGLVLVARRTRRGGPRLARARCRLRGTTTSRGAAPAVTWAAWLGLDLGDPGTAAMLVDEAIELDVGSRRPNLPRPGVDGALGTRPAHRSDGGRGRRPGSRRTGLRRAQATSGVMPSPPRCVHVRPYCATTSTPPNAKRWPPSTPSAASATSARSC